MDARIDYLTKWAQSLAGAATAGGLGGKPLTIRRIETVRGPRAGALEIDAGLDAGNLLRALSRDDAALARQFVPWQFSGAAGVYMSGRYIRIEAGWPDRLAEKDIPLASLGQRPSGGGRWIAGKNELGATVTLGLSDSTAHYLVAGATGSGKSWGLRSAVAQLARDHRAHNRLILLDGKWGETFGDLEHLPGLVGPCAYETDDVRGALAWAVREMRRRYETRERGDGGRLIVAFDEFQELTGDPAIVEMLRRLTAQGRGVGVHCLLATQAPLQSVFGDSTIKRNLTGRLAFRVDSYKSSEVAIGSSSPRADHLMGAGDAYAVTPGATHRLQCAYVTDREIPTGGRPELDAWPYFDAEAAGTLPEDAGCNAFQVSAVESAVSILAAHLGKGQPTVKRMMEDATGNRPGGSRADRLRDYGREALAWLNAEGWGLCDDVC